ncbi:hypothetical protein [Paraburkholderia sp. BCC1876]|uniref:hypothetical protein n=1 Tax=Paraburkholderia sp. BCC1876 TaxID=2676303 RepID=UPI001591FA4E|nr:hypothetical protein [Paraburkholderia sp. BCC1876]
MEKKTVLKAVVAGAFAATSALSVAAPVSTDQTTTAQASQKQADAAVLLASIDDDFEVLSSSPECNM